MFNQNPNIAVIGLGYVGLPLAIALARHFPVIGFDINTDRIEELKTGFDRTREIEDSILKKTALRFTSNDTDLRAQNIYILTVPTPVTHDNVPDLEPLKKASKLIGHNLSQNAIVVFESTVYPGVTEDFCGPILEAASGLKAGQDFYLGYSPERINPGDKEHTIDRITKVVAGQTKEVANQLKNIYGAINNNNVFVAKNIKTAEAAKVIENAQRDINIAFINEIATIVGKLGLSIFDVLAAANTKWNFLNFQPGLVGGHCIGVDPYYLAHCARNLNHEPEVILSGRRTNENMGEYIATTIHEKLQSMNKKPNQTRILILGLTFKENIPDLRNTKVIDIFNQLKIQGYPIDVHDVEADATEADRLYQINLLKTFDYQNHYDCIIGAVPHKAYLNLTKNDFEKLLRTEGGRLIADIKNMWGSLSLSPGVSYWTL